jgi:hypothetical protein
MHTKERWVYVAERSWVDPHHNDDTSTDVRELRQGCEVFACPFQNYRYFQAGEARWKITVLARREPVCKVGCLVGIFWWDVVVGLFWWD